MKVCVIGGFERSSGRWYREVSWTQEMFLFHANKKMICGEKWALYIGGLQISKKVLILHQRCDSDLAKPW